MTIEVKKYVAYAKACKRMNQRKNMVKVIDKEIAAEDTVKETRKEIGLRDER